MIDSKAIETLFTNARSYNSWSDQPIDQETIEAVYDLAKMGPTSSNSCPARFVWVTTSDAKQTLADCAMGSNPEKILAAPATVIIGRDMNFAEKMPELFPHGEHMHKMMQIPAVAEATAIRNATLQGAYLIMAARAMGLDCGPMSGFDNGKVDAAFFTGSSIKSDFICTIGYGTEEGLFPRLPRLSFGDANQIV